MIVRVKLLNFTCHKETEIKFPEGLTIFLGRNGSGKSSVIDGITYALYGKHMKGGNRNIVRDGTDSGRVELEFEYRGSKYQIVRSFDVRGNLESATLRKDGELIASGEKRGEETVSKAVQELFELNYDRMRTAVIIQQGELDKILSADPKDLKELFDDLMGLTAMEKAYYAMLEVLKSFEERVVREVGRPPREADKVGEELRGLEKKAETGEETRASLQKELDKLKRMKEKVDARIKELRQVRELLEKIRLDLLTLRDLLNDKVTRLRDISEKGLEYLKLIELKDDIEKRVKSVEELDKKIEKIKGDLFSLKARREEASKRLKEIEDELGRVKVDASKAKTLKELEKEARVKAEKLRDDAIELGRTLAISKGGQINLLSLQVDQEVEEVVAVVSEAYSSALASHVANREKERDQVSKQLEEIDRELRSLTKKLDEAKKERDNLSKLYGKEVSWLREEVKRASEELEKIGGPEGVKKAKAMLEEAKRSLETLNQVIWGEVNLEDQLLEDISRLIGEEGEQLLPWLKERVKEARKKEFNPEELGRLEVEEKGLIKLISDREARLESVEKELEEAKKKIKELQRVREVLVRAERFYRLMDKVRNELFYRDGVVLRSLRTWIFRKVADHAKSYLDAFDVRIDDVKIEESGVKIMFKCFFRGREVDMSRLSGGEKVALALALRFAIGDVLGAQRLGFFILDEPTIHLDSENRKRLLDVFTSLSKAVRQVIIITHDEEVFEGAEAKIFRFERELSTNAPTMIDEVA
ncbi:putative DNA double-strand break repair Rad50 ATPase [Candidatus Calditenuaceae archaeon HR02]|nr:putative DNA double-strand break repair Rad50 ATPase [Candidatus Calditenuaceae archaeon HR02]